MAALFLSLGLLWLICALAYGERISRAPRELRVGDTVKVQRRLHVFIDAKVLRVWANGEQRYAEVADPNGERYIRATDLLERP